MKKLIFITLFAAVAACHQLPKEQSMLERPEPLVFAENNSCDLDTLRSIEQQVSSQDSHAHGPDLGSLEWARSIEYQLQLPSDPAKSHPLSNKWCEKVNQALDKSPSFQCSKPLSQIEGLVCNSPSLIALDNQLHTIYQRALTIVSNTDSVTDAATLKAVQRGWAKGRDECWKSENKQACVSESYRQRIDEIQLQYGLISPTSSLSYQCGNERVDVQIFSTTVEKVLVSKGKERFIMHRLESTKGAKYQGRNESFWIKGETALAQWQYQGPTMSCTLL